MRYSGYLRRNPADLPYPTFDGSQFWLSKLNQFCGSFIAAKVVKAFLSSIESMRRFSQ
jgi:hypothetical protein